MKARFLFLIVASSALLASQACKVTITDDADGSDSDGSDSSDDGEECGDRPADYECGVSWVCVDGAWQEIQTDEECYTCPEFRPGDGEACPDVGMECDYEEWTDCGDTPTYVTAQCTDTGWVTFWTRCEPPPECPAEMPVVGTDCSDWGWAAYWCSYENAECATGYAELYCDASQDPPLWVESNPGSCAGGSCRDIGDRETCGLANGCQWLEPGCASEPEQQPIEAGCYPVVDCLDNFTCALDEACIPYVYNPCFEQKCDACGGEYWACGPATPGG